MADEQQQEVTLKPEAVKVKQAGEKPYQGVISKEEHDIPAYFTPETLKIAQDRKKEQDAKGEQPYEFSANGYTVKQRKAEEQEKGFADDGGFVYTISGNDLPERVYGNKRDAEIFAQTHAPHFAQMDATMPSV